MKKKYVIEIEETTFNAADVFAEGNYPNSGWYMNTDENSVKTLILSPERKSNAPIGLWDWPMPENELINLLGEPLKEFNEPQELEAIQDIQSGISEDALLKAIAIAQNPELIKDILK